MDFGFQKEGELYSTGTTRLTSRGGLPGSASSSSKPIETEPFINGARQKTEAEKKLEFKQIPTADQKPVQAAPIVLTDDELFDRDDSVVNLDKFTLPKYAKKSGQKEKKQQKFERPLINENDLKNNTRKVVYIDANVPKYGMLFWVEIIQIIWMTTTSIVGLLVLTHAVVINNYVFLISGALLTLILCSLQVFLYFVQVNKYPNLSREGYYNEIGTAVVTTFVMEVFTWLSLGIWIRDFAICCDQANCQPNPADINNFTRFYLSYILLMTLPLVTMVWVYPRSIAAHLNPTLIYTYSKKDE